MIALIDYGAGNLASVKKALAASGAEMFVPARPNELESARGLIVPGVGHFGATRALNGQWTDAIRRHVDLGRPLLGICLGMQWLFEGSEEAPEVSGLGVIRGRCHRLANTPQLKIPHVGWNNIDIVREAAIARGVTSGSQVPVQFDGLGVRSLATPAIVAVNISGPDDGWSTSKSLPR